MEKLLGMWVQELFTHSSRHSTHPASCLSLQGLEVESIRFKSRGSSSSYEKQPYKLEPELAAVLEHWAWIRLEKKN